jgi:hypothetical protein
MVMESMYGTGGLAATVSALARASDRIGLNTNWSTDILLSVSRNIC